MSGLTRKIRTDEKGVSPVIGVILMVAITVILAAVIASFVFGMGSKVQAAPQAQLMVEDNADMIGDDNDDILFNVTHYGGDDLKCDELKLQVLNATVGPYTLVWNGDQHRFEADTNDDDTADFIATDTVGTNDLEDGIFSVGETFGVYEDGANVFDKSPDTLTFRVIHIPTGNIIYETDVKVQ